MSGLVSLDWGTTSLRAHLHDAAGRVTEVRTRPWGMRQLPAGGYPAALAAITAGWPAWPRIACGMVGSRGGWHEVPYLDLPLAPAQLAAALVALPLDDGMPLWLVPGLRDARGPDVMRGEETQLLGALCQQPALAADATCILPGTHSKWVQVRHGAIRSLRTLMTGELFAVLRQHSILGAGAADAASSPDAFARGAAAVRDSGAAGAFGRLFSARTLMLEGTLAGSAVPDYLSGLLIGEEFRVAIASGCAAPGTPLQLIGEPVLCRRYLQAGRDFGLALQPPLTDSAASGLWRLAVLAGIIHEATTPC